MMTQSMLRLPGPVVATTTPAAARTMVYSRPPPTMKNPFLRAVWQNALHAEDVEQSLRDESVRRLRQFPSAVTDRDGSANTDRRDS